MTDKEIQTVALSIATALDAPIDFVGEYELFLKELLRRYCLVEKEVVRTTYQQAMEQGKHAHLKCQVESRAKLRLLERLFPEIEKEVEE